MSRKTGTDGARVALVTCNQWPELSESDRLYAEALAARGVTVTAAPWNGPLDAFLGADLIVLRSNWDYHHYPDRFLAWLDGLVRRGQAVLNPAPMVRWNLDKRYLLDLAARGVPIPATCIVERDPAAIVRVLDELGWERAVVKPSVGASGHGVVLVERGRPPAIDAVSAAGDRRPLLLQEYMPEIGQSGELSCVFFDGAFSHAVVKRPVAGEFRINSGYGGAIASHRPEPALVEQARAVLAALDETPLYARVDGVARDGGFVLMELELNEPGLVLQYDPPAAGRFAAATVVRLWDQSDRSSPATGDARRW